MSVAPPQPVASDIPITPPPYPALSQAAVTALWKGQVIDAIKLVRMEQNLDLHEAKDVIDRYLRSQPALKNQIDEAHADAREGLFRWVIFLLAGGVGLAYVLM